MNPPNTQTKHQNITSESKSIFLQTKHFTIKASPSFIKQHTSSHITTSASRYPYFRHAHKQTNNPNHNTQNVFRLSSLHDRSRPKASLQRSNPKVFTRE